MSEGCNSREGGTPRAAGGGGGGFGATPPFFFMGQAMLNIEGSTAPEEVRALANLTLDRQGIFTQYVACQPACMVAGEFRSDESVLAPEGRFDYRYVFVGPPGFLVVQTVLIRIGLFEVAPARLTNSLTISFSEVFRLSLVAPPGVGGRAVDRHRVPLGPVVSEVPELRPIGREGRLRVDMRFQVFEQVATTRPVPLDTSLAEEANETFGFEILESFPAAGQGALSATVLDSQGRAVRQLTRAEILRILAIEPRRGNRAGAAPGVAGAPRRCLGVSHAFEARMTRVPDGFDIRILDLPPQANYA